MILLWVTLLLLRQGYTLVPVITAQLGEPAAFTCPLPEHRDSRSKLHWYKQNPGDSLSLIVKFQKLLDPEYGHEFSASRLNVLNDDKTSNLTILKATQEDEGTYHCAFIDWNKNTWHGTYLSIKGETEKTSHFTVAQPAGPSELRGGNLTLQCSVFSDSTNKTCSEDLSVFWFRASSDQSYPNIIYSDGNHRDTCEKTPASQKRCVFSKNITSSDLGTYYCAVAACGQILTGQGTKVETKLDFQVLGSQDVRTIILCVILAVSLIVIAILICSFNKKTFDDCKVVELQKHRGPQMNQKRGGWIYSAAVFTAVRADGAVIKS